MRAMNRPVNVVTGLLDPDIMSARLSEAGVKRINLSGALSLAWVRDMIDSAEPGELFNGDRDRLVGCERHRRLCSGRPATSSPVATAFSRFCRHAFPVEPRTSYLNQLRCFQTWKCCRSLAICTGVKIALASAKIASAE